MRKLTVFNSITLDGYFCDERNDIRWAHKQDPEWISFVSENASGGGELVLGRVTYQMLANHWDTPAGRRDNPVVAESMTEQPKIVFSKTLEKASWKNTRLIRDDIVSETRKLKGESGKDLVILGSGSIVSQLTDARLIDEYQLVLNPIVLGRGRTMFEGIKEKLGLISKRSRTFENGNFVLWYELERR